MVNRLVRSVASIGLIVAGLAFQNSKAQASFVITASATGSAFAGASYGNLNGLALGSAGGVDGGGLSVAFIGDSAAAVQGDVRGQYSAPILSGANNTFFGPPATGTDTTTYASSGSGSVALTFANGAQNYLGLLWGSVDNYNTLSFFDANNNSVGSIRGSTILELAEGGNPTGSQFVNIVSTLSFTRVVASSTSNSFEFDNVAFATVPEPSSIAMCGVASLIGLAVAKKRVKRTVA